MYLTVHTPTSLIIGSQINQPIISFILAFLAHFVLDIIPHDPQELHKWAKKNHLKRTFYIAFIDVALVSIFLFILWQNGKLTFNAPMILAIIGGIMPDILWGLDDLSKGKIKILNVYHKIHHKIHQLVCPRIFISLKQAVLIQGAIFILTLWIYLKL